MGVILTPFPFSTWVDQMQKCLQCSERRKGGFKAAPPQGWIALDCLPPSRRKSAASRCSTTETFHHFCHRKEGGPSESLRTTLRRRAKIETVARAPLALRSLCPKCKVHTCNTRRPRRVRGSVNSQSWKQELAHFSCWNLERPILTRL